jgi:hypothetical protein
LRSDRCQLIRLRIFSTFFVTIIPGGNSYVTSYYYVFSSFLCNSHSENQSFLGHATNCLATIIMQQCNKNTKIPLHFHQSTVYSYITLYSETSKCVGSNFLAGSFTCSVFPCYQCGTVQSNDISYLSDNISELITL